MFQRKPKSMEDKFEFLNDYFPNEILEEILSKLTQKSDICNAKLTCRRWRFVVDEMVGHDISVTNYANFIRNLAQDPDKLLLSLPTSVKDVSFLTEYPKIAIRNLKIGMPELISDSLTQTIKTTEISEFPRSVYPHVLRSLSCFEPLPSNIFNALTPMRNLTYLNISLLSLANLTEGTSFQNVFPLRCLTTLIVSNLPTHADFNSTFAVSPLNNLLEQLTAPNLAVLDITYPILSLLDIEDDSTRYIINLVKRSPYINKLSISVSSPNQNFSPPSKQFQYPMDLMEEMETLGSQIRPRSMELKDNHLHSLRPSVQTKAWIVFMKQQTHLRSLKLYLKSSIDLTDISTLVEKNGKTLVNLDLSCFPCENCAEGDIYFLPIDGRTIAKCSDLKTLLLSDKTINTVHFPHSLTYIYINAMLTNEDAHNVILAENMNLKQIDLKDIRGGSPKTFGCGVSLETLYQFVKKRIVHRLVIYAGSTDDKFPPEGIPNGDSGDSSGSLLRKRKPPKNLNDTPTQQRFAQNQNQSRIDWQLNARGFYEDNNYDSYEDKQNKNATEANHSLFKCDRLMLNFH